MNVAIDTNGIYVSRAGVATYIRGLLRGLRRVAPEGMSFVESAWPVQSISYQQPVRALKTAYREFIWPVLAAPRALRRQKVDLLHITSGVILRPPYPAKQVTTLHDLALLRHPGRFRRWHRWSRRLRVAAAGRCDRILCDSRFTADEAISLLGLPASMLEVVHIACNFGADEPAPAAQPPAAELPSEFFLFVGSLEPGKNLSLLGQAYRLAADRGIHLPPLVIVGGRWAGVAAEAERPASWIYLGWQPEPVLVHLYRSAVALLFPSKYEGFGIPVLEAMSLGCPAICSPVSSLPEVAGDAALFAALQPEAYLQAMHQILNDERLRAELREKGRRQAAGFSWTRCARETIAVYESVLGA